MRDMRHRLRSVNRRGELYIMGETGIGGISSAFSILSIKSNFGYTSGNGGVEAGLHRG